MTVSPACSASQRKKPSLECDFQWAVIPISNLFQFHLFIDNLFLSIGFVDSVFAREYSAVSISLAEVKRSLPTPFVAERSEKN